MLQAKLGAGECLLRHRTGRGDVPANVLQPSPRDGKQGPLRCAMRRPFSSSRPIDISTFPQQNTVAPEHQNVHTGLT